MKANRRAAGVDGLQILQPLIDPSFSNHSHGFRPGRSAHDAVLNAQRQLADSRIDQIIIFAGLYKALRALRAVDEHQSLVL